MLNRYERGYSNKLRDVRFRIEKEGMMHIMQKKHEEGKNTHKFVKCGERSARPKANVFFKWQANNCRHTFSEPNQFSG